ncbi:MAG: hypothetical protein ACLFWG_07815, partial [Longimicrobiales bacterium]
MKPIEIDGRTYSVETVVKVDLEELKKDRAERTQALLDAYAGDVEEWGKLWGLLMADTLLKPGGAAYEALRALFDPEMVAGRLDELRVEMLAKVRSKYLEDEP